MKEIEVFHDEGIVNVHILDEYEKIIGFKFPNNYKTLLSKHNGLYPEKDSFNYYDEVVKREEGNGIFFYFFKEINQYQLGDSSSSMVYFLMDNEGFKKGVIPFGGTGNGDYICFDYSDNLKTDNPKIVLLHHDAPDDDNNLIISFLSNSFEEFMDSLYEYSED